MQKNNKQIVDFIDPELLAKLLDSLVSEQNLDSQESLKEATNEGNLT